jgi:hypothetical protein
MKSINNILLLLLVSVIASQYAFAFDVTDKWSRLEKEEKILYTNLGGAMVITAWGVANWDYFKTTPHAGSEGWFGKDTSSGGADKLGHLYSSYVASHALTYLYESWGYNSHTAARYAALSSFGWSAFMEVGDSFSESFGFSYEDLIMGGLGSYIGYLTTTNPALARKLDLRIEYDPTGDNDTDIFTDYENSKYMLALKLDGFGAVRNKYLKYVELHLGYYTRGFSTAGEENKRKLYAGIGINFSRIFSERSHRKTATFLKYFQVPYSYVEFDHDVD